VTLLTIHAAKGLEFGAVVVVGVEDDLIPHLTSAEVPGGLDEERRILHVAMTRAKRRLILTCASTRTRFGRDQSSAPSRFLADLGSEGVVWRGAGSLEGRSALPGPEVEMELDPDNPLLRLKPGSAVKHPDYGLGRVLHVRGRHRGFDATVTLRFEDGTERGFILRYSGLSAVEDPEF
jgi:DNA helicase-2/ATP-dependent DNA helicase PcrA